MTSRFETEGFWRIGPNLYAKLVVSDPMPLSAADEESDVVEKRSATLNFFNGPPPDGGRRPCVPESRSALRLSSDVRDMLGRGPWLEETLVLFANRQLADLCSDSARNFYSKRDEIAETFVKYVRAFARDVSARPSRT